MHRIREFFTAKQFRDTRRLTVTYLVIIMSLTVVFSSVIYVISTTQLDRPLSGVEQQGMSSLYQYDMEYFLKQRANEARSQLVASLVALNITVFIGGVLLSYVLARKTLQPIEAAMEAQSRFISDASHELRTPLTALQVTNEVALRKKKLSLKEARELIEYNLSETNKLRSLSQALLGLAIQYEEQLGDELAKEEFSLEDSIASVAASFAPIMKSKSITFTQAPSTSKAVANRQAYESIMRILLDNAVKYAPNNSTITVAIKQKNNHLVTVLSDEGPGIAYEQQAKIFDRFYRIDESRSSQNVEGSGLGLSIAKNIATRHGFGLSVRSTVGKGSDFSVTISH